MRLVWKRRRVGRKRALSITIILTCTATGLIGFIPEYAVIGWAAPLLLLLFRLIQSLGTGSEYTTAISFVYEHGEKGRKARAVGSLTALTFVGLLVGALFATIISSLMTVDAYEAWGWRILFLLSLPMGLIGLYLRRKTEEGEEFQEAQAAAEKSAGAKKRTPVLDSFRTYWRRIAVFAAFLGTWAIISATMTNYLATLPARERISLRHRGERGEHPVERDGGGVRAGVQPDRRSHRVAQRHAGWSRIGRGGHRSGLRSGWKRTRRGIRGGSAARDLQGRAGGALVTRGEPDLHRTYPRDRRGGSPTIWLSPSSAERLRSSPSG